MAQATIQPLPPVVMTPPKGQALSPRPSSFTTLDSLKYHASSVSKHFLRRRYLLTLLAIIVMIIIALSIVFVAHAYYHQFGGQGFLKARDDLHIVGNDLPRLFLPFRKVQAGWIDQGKEGGSPLANLPWNIRALGPGSNIPFYTCGDQTNSCEAYDQPNICCPFGLNCYKATFTNSGIFCCNSTVSEWPCEHPEQKAPRCLDSMVECSIATGGGCCPSALECSPNGCIHVSPASVISASSADTSATQSASQDPSHSGSGSLASQTIATPNSVSITGTPITVTNTITIAPKATVTLAKSGEVLDVGSGVEQSLMTKMYLPYSLGYALLGVALAMGML